MEEDPLSAAIAYRCRVDEEEEQEAEACGLWDLPKPHLTDREVRTQPQPRQRIHDHYLYVSLKFFGLWELLTIFFHVSDAHQRFPCAQS